jgi:hypothetical protein
MDSALSDFFLSAPPIKPWLHMPEVPLADEFMAETTLPLPLNDFEARPQLRGQYLETQYRLHRYEVVEPLRRAIQTLRSAQPQTQSTPINQNTDEIAVVKLENVNFYSRASCVSFSLPGTDLTLK